MTIFKSQKTTDLEARVQELEDENTDLRGQLEIAKQNAETDQAAALTNATEEIKNLTEANATIPELESKISELESKVTELEAANVVTAEKIDTAAAQKLASMGHGEPLNLGASTPSNTTISAYDEYRQLQKTDPRAAAKFWDENEAKIKSH
jgi:predicted RNase H-like nuclease (RuvC/YqgF family)